MTLVLRRLLASSTFAAAGALETIAARLNHMLKTGEGPKSMVNKLELDCEGLDEIAEELNLESDLHDDEETPDFDPSAVKREQDWVMQLVHLAASIKDNAKGKALIQALRVGFAKMRELGAAEKAIIFTESRRTQNYLLRILEESEFSEGLIPFNGTNTDERSKSIYAKWLIQHQNTDRNTGAKSADMRAALVDYFRNAGRIMIATEAGAEGINLQFCSMIVNYDLPWNPQRIEQRIGRCHRYGQKHDVVVINFLNRNNAADQQVYKLLSEKLRLFEGVFGASDEILGAIENGVDFEKRISDIYQQCRKTDEIKTAFDQLQIEMTMEINESLSGARRKLLENFDEEVRDKLRLRDVESKERLTRHDHMLMELSRYELAGHAEFIDDGAFRLVNIPTGIDTVPGLHELPRRGGSYRAAHPLAEAIILRAKVRELPVHEIEFKNSGKKAKYKSGWVKLSNMSIQFTDQEENHPVLSGISDSGEPIPQEFLKDLFLMAGKIINPIIEAPPTQLGNVTDLEQAKLHQEIEKRNKRFYDAEVDKLDGWAEDLKLNLEREIKEIDIQLKDARRPSSGSSLEEKLASQKKVKRLEHQRNEKRQALAQAQQAIDLEKEMRLALIKSNLNYTMRSEPIFTIHWKLV